MPEPHLPLVKTDRRGRLCLPRAKREELLDEFERSGLSGAEFARVVGVKYQTFANWRQARARKRHPHASAAQPEPRAAPLQWAEASLLRSSQPIAAAGASALVVRLPSGVQVELTCRSQAETAAALLRAWEKLSC